MPDLAPPARPLIAALLALAALLVGPAAAAHADLRSPRLTSNCPSGYAYSEEGVGPWTVEGCNKTATPRGAERARLLFRGTVEANGLLIEPTGNSDLIATLRDDPNSSSGTIGELDRSESTKLVLDPLIQGQRRRIVLYTGAVHLDGRQLIGDSVAANGYVPVYDDDVQAVALSRTDPTDSIAGGGVLKPGAAPIATRQATRGGSVDLPVGGVPSLLGLRVMDDIEGAALTDDGMRFDMTMNLGSAAPALMRDTAGSAEIVLDDGGGMRVTELRFRIGHIAIPGVGGFDHFRIHYSEADDEWSGGFILDLGDLFPGLDFAASVSASSGIPTSMRLEVEPLNIPLGNTGIVLQSVRAGFILDPLTVSGGAGVTAGPQIAGAALIRADGDLTIALEPRFRMEAGGSVRILPVGNDNQLARGDMMFILDSDGLISLTQSARYEATFLGFGVSARISGDGAYSNDANLFNIGASATGTLELGFLGSADIVSYGAVVSSDGWGTCGNVYPFVSAGIGQDWDENLKLILGCDLSPFRVNVGAGARAHRSRAAVRTTTFRVPEGLERAAIELTADRPGPRVRLTDPSGKVVVTTGATGREVGPDAAWFTDDRNPRQLIFLKSPAPGTWTAQTLSTDPQITQVRTAVTAEPLQGEVEVTGPDRRTGKRRAALKRIRGVYPGERLRFSVKSGQRVVPLGDLADVPAGGAVDTKWFVPELDSDMSGMVVGRREVVVQVIRDGVPVPGRTATVGSFSVAAPAPPARIIAKRSGRKLRLLARPAATGPLPQAWEYRLRTSAGTVSFQRKVGQPLKLWLPRRGLKAKLVVRPVIGGKVSAGNGRSRQLRYAGR